ncbi:formate dehydrogenase [Candidatus Magnetoovum chiemensis]|nr:formate dehydrogenase [Candidatus Magnetoovum chiemensis]
MSLLEHRKSICRICHGGCGAVVYTENGKIVKVKGDSSSPLSRGWMCIKGLRSPDIANHRDRLRAPLKRVGKKPSAAFKEISWHDALDEISHRIDNIKTASGAQSIAIGQGTGRHHYMHVVRFANALGTPNWYEPGLAQCFIPRITVSNLTYGGFLCADYYNNETKPACIMFWGHNPLVSSADGELAVNVNRALQSKSVKTIAVDPRRSETAKKCSIWLPVRPGTDAALALSMINVIIEGSLYDAEFVNNWCAGFDDLKQHVKPFTLKWAETITGVKADDIKQAAIIYASNKPSALEWGVGIEQNANSLQTARALAILRALTGSIDTPGGDILGMKLLKAYPTLRDKLPKDAAKNRLGAETFKLLGGWRAYMPSAHIPALLDAMISGNPYKIRALMIFGNNPLLTVANSRKVCDALSSLDFVVVTDLFKTPTCLFADYVLPAAFWTEIEHLIAYPLVAENMVFAQSKITQTGQCRQDEWIIDEISKRLNLTGSNMTYRDIFDYQLSSIGMTFDELLKNEGYYSIPHKYYKYKDEGLFKTPSKKVELKSSILERLGCDALPTYTEPSESPLSAPEIHKDYPFVLITGARKREFFHSEHRMIASLREKYSKDPRAEIHLETAKALDIQDDDWTLISTIRGQIRMRAKLTKDIAPNVISVEHGWWFPERLDDIESAFCSNANVLTKDTPPYDPAFGSYQLRGLLCNVTKTN